MTETTIKECITWLEDIIGDSLPQDILPLEATIAHLRDYTRMKAMLDDPKVVRVPKDWAYWPGIERAKIQVAAWDKERK